MRFMNCKSGEIFRDRDSISRYPVNFAHQCVLRFVVDENDSGLYLYHLLRLTMNTFLPATITVASLLAVIAAHFYNHRYKVDHTFEP